MAALCSKSNQEFYDRISPIYDQFFVTHELHANTIIKMLLDRYQGQEERTLVLDLGCGTGLLSKGLIGRGFIVIGVDISLESLSLLQAREPEIYTIKADATLLPFNNASCDAVVSLGAWRHFRDPQQVIIEIARVLKSEGLLIVGYFPPAIGGVIHQGDSLWYQLLARLYQFVIRKRGYVDNTDPSLEQLTISWAKEYFGQVSAVDSGKRWRLIVAKRQGYA